MRPTPTLVTAAALALSAWTLCAQDRPADRPPGGPPREAGPRPAGDGQRQMPGFFTALDANHDGAIDAEELSHAAEALRRLDSNGDGKLTPDELRPAGEGQRDHGPQPGRPDGVSHRDGRGGGQQDSAAQGHDGPHRPGGDGRNPSAGGPPRGSGPANLNPPQDRGARENFGDRRMPAMAPRAEGMHHPEAAAGPSCGCARQNESAQYTPRGPQNFQPPQPGPGPRAGNFRGPQGGPQFPPGAGAPAWNQPPHRAGGPMGQDRMMQRPDGFTAPPPPRGRDGEQHSRPHEGPPPGGF